MTKADLVEQVTASIARTAGPMISKKDCARVVDAFLEAVKDALKQQHNIEVRGFGTFKIRRRKTRMARNPRTGDPVEVAARPVPVFKPSKELRALVADEGEPAAGAGAGHVAGRAGRVPRAARGALLAGRPASDFLPFHARPRVGIPSNHVHSPPIATSRSGCCSSRATPSGWGRTRSTCAVPAPPRVARRARSACGRCPAAISCRARPLLRAQPGPRRPRRTRAAGDELAILPPLAGG